MLEDLARFTWQAALRAIVEEALRPCMERIAREAAIPAAPLGRNGGRARRRRQLNRSLARIFGAFELREVRRAR